MLVVMGNEGCKDTLILIISEDTDVTANPLLSPNGDGINDVWLIDGLSNYPQCKVNVLNRWGQVLFSSVGYSTPWDGTYNGTLLPVSDYFYIIDFGDGTVNKGTITIKY
jgi:gliding motility-associated-like protein